LPPDAPFAAAPSPHHQYHPPPCLGPSPSASPRSPPNPTRPNSTPGHPPPGAGPLRGAGPKADIFSLGVIFFEAFLRPQTVAERQGRGGDATALPGPILPEREGGGEGRGGGSTCSLGGRGGRGAELSGAHTVIPLCERHGQPPPRASWPPRRRPAPGAAGPGPGAAAAAEALSPGDGPRPRPPPRPAPRGRTQTRVPHILAEPNLEFHTAPLGGTREQRPYTPTPRPLPTHAGVSPRCPV